MQTKTALVLLSALASAAVTGCDGKTSSTPNGPAGAVRASLHRAKSCGDLLTDLKDDALYKLDKGIDRQIEQIRWCQAKYGDAQCASGAYFGGYGERGVAMDDAAGGTPPPQATPTAGGDAKAESPSSSASSYSQTNTQVKGVDEADIVKNDGKNLYVLHGRAFKVVNAWPASDLKEVSSTDIEGTPTEMFVDSGKVVVYSQVNGAAIFAAAGIAPKTQFVAYGYGGGYATDAKAMPTPGRYNDYGGTPEQYAPLTKVTVLTLDNGTPTVTREVYFEGNYLDARRVGPHVRTVFQGYQYGPQLKYSTYDLHAVKDANGNVSYPQGDDWYPKNGTQSIAQLEELRSANTAIINASQLTDWLPNTFVKNGAAVNAQTVRCEDFYVPTVGSTESGLTEVASLDLSNPSAVPQETAILGRADVVYGNADTLYLSAQAWIEPPFTWYDDAVAVSGGSAGSGSTASPPVAADTPASEPVEPKPAPGGTFTKGNTLRPQTGPSTSASISYWSSTRTHVHKFEFTTEPSFPNYVASGTVAGAVKDQFSLDEKDGNLRVATTEGRQYYKTNGMVVNADFSTVTPGSPPPSLPASVSHVTVLAQNGAWLEQVGEVADLAPNEQIYSVRFLENRGYVVTFRQVDPLFVIDLSAPTNPTLLASLKIPGFSEYMHPLDANHLLTIGRDADTNGRTRGLALQIFDVTDGKNPVLAQKFTYTGEEYGGSDAEYDHKAFTYFADKNLLAFPYYSYGETMKSTLELFKVDLATGFTKLGAIDSTDLVEKNPTGYCGGYYGPSVRRGVFLENFVYSISYGGVIAKDSTNLAQAGVELALPSPEINQGYGPVCAAE